MKNESVTEEDGASDNRLEKPESYWQQLSEDSRQNQLICFPRMAKSVASEPECSDRQPDRYRQMRCRQRAKKEKELAGTIKANTVPGYRGNDSLENIIKFISDKESEKTSASPSANQNQGASNGSIQKKVKKAKKNATSKSVPPGMSPAIDPSSKECDDGDKSDDKSCDKSRDKSGESSEDLCHLNRPLKNQQISKTSDFSMGGLIEIENSGKNDEVNKLHGEQVHVDCMLSKRTSIKINSNIEVSEKTTPSNSPEISCPSNDLEISHPTKSSEISCPQQEPHNDSQITSGGISVTESGIFEASIAGSASKECSDGSTFKESFDKSASKKSIDEKICTTAPNVDSETGHHSSQFEESNCIVKSSRIIGSQAETKPIRNSSLPDEKSFLKLTATNNKPEDNNSLPKQNSMNCLNAENSQDTPFQIVKKRRKSKNNITDCLMFSKEIVKTMITDQRQMNGMPYFRRDGLRHDPTLLNLDRTIEHSAKHSRHRAFSPSSSTSTQSQKQRDISLSSRASLSSQTLDSGSSSRASLSSQTTDSGNKRDDLDHASKLNSLSGSQESLSLKQTNDSKHCPDSSKQNCDNSRPENADVVVVSNSCVKLETNNVEKLSEGSEIKSNHKVAGDAILPKSESNTSQTSRSTDSSAELSTKTIVDSIDASSHGSSSNTKPSTGLHEGSSKNKQVVFLDTRNIADRSSMPHELDISFGFDLEEDNDFKLKQECETNNAQQITSTYSIEKSVENVGLVRQMNMRPHPRPVTGQFFHTFPTALPAYPFSTQSINIPVHVMPPPFSFVRYAPPPVRLPVGVVPPTIMMCAARNPVQSEDSRRSISIDRAEKHRTMNSFDDTLDLVPNNCEEDSVPNICEEVDFVASDPDKTISGNDSRGSFDLFKAQNFLFRGNEFLFIVI